MEKGRAGEEGGKEEETEAHVEAKAVRVRQHCGQSELPKDLAPALLPSTRPRVSIQKCEIL